MRQNKQNLNIINTYQNVENYLNPKLRNLLKDPYHLHDMDKAVKTIYNADENKLNIYMFSIF